MLAPRLIPRSCQASFHAPRRWVGRWIEKTEVQKVCRWPDAPERDSRLLRKSKPPKTRCAARGRSQIDRGYDSILSLGARFAAPDDPGSRVALSACPPMSVAGLHRSFRLRTCQPRAIFKLAVSTQSRHVSPRFFVEESLTLLPFRRGGEAAVVDPKRDTVIPAAADREGLRITAILNSHPHADFASGFRELSERTGAKVYVSHIAPAKYEQSPRKDGDRSKLGSLEVEFSRRPGIHRTAFFLVRKRVADRDFQPATCSS